MMTTYAEVLRKKTMNEQKRKEKWPQTVSIKEKPDAVVTIDISDDIFLRVAKEAHERDITFNSMVLSIIKDGLKNVEYRFEHDSRPQLLNEDN